MGAVAVVILLVWLVSGLARTLALMSRSGEKHGYEDLRGSIVTGGTLRWVRFRDLKAWIHA